MENNKTNTQATFDTDVILKNTAFFILSVEPFEDEPIEVTVSTNETEVILRRQPPYPPFPPFNPKPFKPYPPKKPKPPKCPPIYPPICCECECKCGKCPKCRNH